MRTDEQADLVGGVREEPRSSEAAKSNIVLEIKNLKMHFPITSGLFHKLVGHLKAVDGVTFSIDRGETLALVGESGCGKTTLGRCIVRIYDPTAGQILYRDGLGETVDLAKASRQDMKVHNQAIRMIFQDPYSSLNPRMTVLDIISEPLKVNKIATGKELEDRVAYLLRRVGLRPEYIRRYPHAFSGGERQRIGIARALALEPRIVVADEAVSALDGSVQAQILNLLRELQEELGLTYLFITHDLSVVNHICDRVAVMYVGKIIEIATRDQLFATPRHPYTEALLSAVPKSDPRMRGMGARQCLAGEVADPANPPSGCYFHPRCPHAGDVCRIETPELREVEKGHAVACHFSEQLKLLGI